MPCIWKTGCGWRIRHPRGACNLLVFFHSQRRQPLGTLLKLHSLCHRNHSRLWRSLQKRTTTKKPHPMPPTPWVLFFFSKVLGGTLLMLLQASTTQHGTKIQYSRLAHSIFTGVFPLSHFTSSKHMRITKVFKWSPKLIAYTCCFWPS